MAVKFSSYSMIKRLLALVVLVAFFACLIVFRLFYLQVVGGYEIVKKGLTQWLRDLPLTATRGKITDRNGVVLASSYTTYDVYVRPADVDDKESLAKLLSQKFELDYNKTLEKISSKLSEVCIQKDIEKQVVQELLKDYQKGLFFTSNTERNYTYDNLLCQILGFVGADNTGQAGLEKFYNTYLQGVDGVSLVESDLKGTTLENSVTYYENAISGLDLALTIDFRIQAEVEKIMTNAMLSTAAKSVSAIVTNPQTGEVLSVCTLPSYNLNDVPRENIQELNALSRATTIVDTFEPGSTFKPIVTAIALEEGLTSQNSYFYCGGFRIINGVRIRCSRRSGHGSQSLEKGLMNSCNCVFMDLAQKIGIKKFYDYLSKLGFNQPLGIDFPGEVSAVLMPESLVTSPDLARMGFGQTIALSALQMVSGMSAVVNGGYVYQPHLISNIKTETGAEVYSRKTTIKNRVFSESTSEIMKKMMFSVVDSGGGRYAKVEGYPIIGGKTGTAQKYENNKIADGKYIASFIGFAPIASPEFMVYVIVDEPKGAYYGGVVAAPIASQIFSKIFEIRGDFMQTGEVQQKNIQLDTLIGMNIVQAAEYLSSHGLQYLVSGDGDYVTSQIPAPATFVAEGDIVLLNFD